MVAIAVLIEPKTEKQLDFENRNFFAAVKPERVSLGDSFLELSPYSSVVVHRSGHLLTFKSLMGKLETNIPAGKWVRFQAGGRYLDITSMDGGRIKVDSYMGTFQLRNVSGDLLMRQGSGNVTRVTKSNFIQVSNGQVEITRLRMPLILSPRTQERIFSLQAEAEVALLFKTAQYSLAQVEYVIFSAGRTIAARGTTDGSAVKLTLKPGNYQIFARSKLSNEYSAWTMPRNFSVWSKPNEVAKAF